MSSIPQTLTVLKVEEPGKSNQNGQTSPLNRTDAGNATRFIKRHGVNVRYCHPWQKWLVFREGYWTVDETGEIIRLAEETVRSIYAEAGAQDQEAERKALARWAIACETEARVRGMLFFAKARKSIPIMPEQLDTNPWLLNVRNGTLDLTTGTRRAQSRADFITKRCNVTHDEQAQCPQWLAFLNRIMNGNQGLIRFLQKAIGYSLSGNTSEQVMFFLYGSGANGKSTFIDIIQQLLGDYAAATPSSSLTAKIGTENIPNDIARLMGVRFVSAVETDDGKRLAESVLKQLTGDKRIPARFMRGEWFDFTPVCKLWLATNHKPQVRGTDNGIWRRIRLIPFTVSIPEQEQDKKLYEKLVEELPGILNWAIEGCLLWQQEGLGMPPEVAEATQAYRSEMDTLADFLSECCRIEPGATSSAKELYSRYTLWCEENGEKAESQKKFGTRLAERGFTRVKNNTIVWYGIGVFKREEREDTDQKSGLVIEKNPQEIQTGNSVSIIPSLPQESDETTATQEEPGKKRVNVKLYGPPARACFKCQTENWYFDEGKNLWQCGTCNPPPQQVERNDTMTP